ncbi:MAG: CHAD domain-containing protein [Bacteroidales bacterium]|nr:CHAD domain-containing protein [Bacteroidales bacterium]
MGNMTDQDFIRLREVKTVLAGYLREAHELLGPYAVSGDKAIHDVRVLMKKSRAVLKLVADQTDPVTFKRDYEACREVGRILGSLRDTSVHRKILKDIKKRHPVLFTALRDNERIAALTGKPEVSRDQLPAVKTDLATAREITVKAGYRLRFQNMNGLEPRMLLDSLDATYKEVVRRHLISRYKPRPGNLHLLRKKAKDLLYQLWLFRPLNPSVIKSLEKRLDSMTGYLGKYNDLAQLLKKLEYRHPGEEVNIYMDQLMLVIRDSQDYYLSKVWPLASGIFTPGKTLAGVLKLKILII